jgi:hypothetical protein
VVPTGRIQPRWYRRQAAPLINVAGVILLVVVFNLLLLFIFALLTRPFVPRSTVERVLLGGHIPGLGWYDRLQLKWVAFPYRGTAA